METKEIETQFNSIAKEYDEHRRKFIPAFEDFYERTTDFIAANMPRPRCILDLGAGTGLLTYFWYKHFPQSEYALVDIADEMLQIAKKRFSYTNHMKFITADYTVDFPQGNYDYVISALSIHHLDQNDKRALFSRIYKKLPTGGVFVNYDQFCGDSPEMCAWFDSYWEDHLKYSGLTEKDISLWKERRKLDKECSVEEERRMLRACGFRTIWCVYSNPKFSVIVATK